MFDYVSANIGMYMSIQHYLWNSPHDVVTNMLDNDIAVSELELQSLFYVHFRTDTLIPPLK